MRPIHATQAAVVGLQRQLTRFEQTASDVTKLATPPDAVRPVEGTRPAQRALQNMDSSVVGSLEGKMVDLRVSKYLAIANMKVIESADEMLRDLLAHVPPKS